MGNGKCYCFIRKCSPNHPPKNVRKEEIINITNKLISK